MAWTIRAIKETAKGNSLFSRNNLYDNMMTLAIHDLEPCE